MKLQEVYNKYPTQSDCTNLLEKLIWNNTPTCPHCGYEKYSPIKNENRYHCNICNVSFSVTVRTIFHKTRADLQKWFYVIDQLLNTDRKITDRGLADEINVTKDTAWRMIKTIVGEIGKNELIYKISQLMK
ncbi:transposase [Mucilaginibacter sp.]|uniref:transposase n=1 Tax=Mucilaginibacter sp. TaxID=1882438 RepID=UPI003D138D2A